jgi:hypothetical protein
VKHLFRYLKGTFDLKLAYGVDPGSEIDQSMFITYSDADHGGNPDNGKSTSGYMVKMGLGAVDWSSKLQSIVTLSSTEAEYVAVNAGKTIKWVQNLLTELGYVPELPSPLRCDNMSAITVAKNPEHHGRMKQLDLCFYWLRDEIAQKRIAIEHLSTCDMPSDLLTKALAKPQVEKLRSMMGLVRSV